VVGLVLAVEGFWGLLKSKLLWGQLFYVGLAWVISQGLARGQAQIGLDISGMLVDLGGGAIFGFALGLTMLKGVIKVFGWLLCFFLLLAVGVEGLIEGGRYYYSDAKALPNQGGDAQKGGSISGTDPRRVPEQVATPKPSLPDDENDPPEIARKRKEAAAFLAAFPTMPTPSGDPEDQRGARAMRDKLVHFEDRWTGSSSGSANLEVETAELSVLCGDMSTAESKADQAILILTDKLTPTKAQGTIRARRVARLYGVLAICSMKKDDAIAAESQLKTALEWDPTLHEVHFFLGRVAPRNSPEQKARFARYVEGVRPDAPEWQKERKAEAKQALGVE
jgi:hypothetical protein